MSRLFGTISLIQLVMSIRVLHSDAHIVHASRTNRTEIDVVWLETEVHCTYAHAIYCQCRTVSNTFLL